MVNVLRIIGCLAVTSVCWSKEVVVNFAVVPSESVVEISLSTGGSDTQVVTYSGLMRALVTYDEQSLLPERFSFLDGRLAVSDSVHRLNSTITFAGLGTFDTGLVFTTEGVAADFVTEGSFSTFDSEGNFLNPEVHKTIINEGRAIVAVTILGETTSQTTEFAAEPVEGEFSGEAYLSIEEIWKTDVSQRLRFTLTYNNGGESSSPLDGTNATIRTVETSAMTALGEMEVRTDYGEWLLDRGLDPDNLPGPDSYRLPLPLLYAFDLPLDATTWPIFTSGSESPYVGLHLPSRGLRATVIPEISDSLEPGNWIPMPSEFYIDGPQSLSYGATGIAYIRLLNGDANFLRFRAEL